MRTSFTWDTILTTVSVACQVERYENSRGTNYKLHPITYPDSFSFHSFAFYFINSVTVKQYTCHTYTMYILRGGMGWGAVHYRHKCLVCYRVWSSNSTYVPTTWSIRQWGEVWLHHVESQEGLHVFLSGGPVQCSTVSQEGSAAACLIYSATTHSERITQNRTVSHNITRST
jgi:hypothetical protein